MFFMLHLIKHIINSLNVFKWNTRTYWMIPNYDDFKHIMSCIA